MRRQDEQQAERGEGTSGRRDERRVERGEGTTRSRQCKGTSGTATMAQHLKATPNTTSMAMATGIGVSDF